MIYHQWNNGGGGRGGGRRLLNGISFGFHGEWRGVQSSPKEYEGGLWKSDCQCVGGGGGESVEYFITSGALRKFYYDTTKIL